jgi:glucose-1-phosphate thymidylyltransferase
LKAVVLARGAGRRMREPEEGGRLTEAQRLAAAAGHKGLMPVGAGNQRPFLDFVLSSLADAGCRDVCLVVAPDHDTIQQHYVSSRPSRVRLSFAVQDYPRGTANALLGAERFVAADPFLAMNADNLYPVDVLRALAELAGPALPAFERNDLESRSGFPPDRVAGFALLEVAPNGALLKIIEKPGLSRIEACGPRALLSMNLWRFDARIFPACRDVAMSARGEYELPEAVQLAMSRGMEFQVLRAAGAVLDLSRRTDVAEVSRRLEAMEARP